MENVVQTEIDDNTDIEIMLQKVVWSPIDQETSFNLLDVLTALYYIQGPPKKIFGVFKLPNPPVTVSDVVTALYMNSIKPEGHLLGRITIIREGLEYLQSLGLVSSNDFGWFSVTSKGREFVRYEETKI